MWQSMMKSIGLLPTEDYIQPRLSIGNAVSDQEFSTGHFKVQVDAQQLALTVKNVNERTIWKSLHNIPFLSSTLGKDIITSEDNGVFRVTETDENPTRLQTITKIERQDENTIKIYGGLGVKLVLPTHMDYIFTFKEVSNRQLQFSVEIIHRDSAMEDYKRILLTYESRPEEHFYGFGEQFSYTTLKGQKVPILVREQGTGRGSPAIASLKDSALGVLGGAAPTDAFATYASIPQYISSDIRCLFMENSEYMSFDLTEPDRVTIRLQADVVQGRILDGRTMLDLLTEYTSYAGRMLPLPDWVSEGVIAGIQGGSEKVKQIVGKLHQYDIPVSAVFLQDWTGQRLQEGGRGTEYIRHWWNWENDDKLYPDWDTLIQTLANDEAGKVRVLSYVNPLLVKCHSKLNVKRNLFPEAQEKGYLVRGTKSVSSESIAYLVKCGVDLEAGILDLTNPEARTWFKQVLKEQVWSSGVSGMMVDFGEHLPLDSSKIVLHSGVPAFTYHNLYPQEWAELNHEVAAELGKEQDSVCFYRSGFTRSPGLMNLFWAGDQNVSWDTQHGIKSAVVGMLTGGFSGFSVTHCDAGGYNSVTSSIPGFKMIRTKELLFRWMELAALTPAFRTSEGITPSLNAQFYDNEDSYEHFAHTAKIFTVLANYRKGVLKEAYEKGWPVLRHPVLYYPNDKIARELTYQQFMIGSSIMVAPVLTASASYVKVYFPKDGQDVTWRHIWTGKYYPGDGSYKPVDTPIGQPPIFVKEPREDPELLYALLDYATSYYQKKARPASK